MTQVKPSDYLIELVNRAKLLLSAQSDYYTDGAKLALTDMVEAAETALEGSEQIPFVRNREFMAPEAEGAIRFSTRRFTMAPSYNEGGRVYHEYGLEPALSWFEQQDIRYGGERELPAKAEFVIAKAKALLAEAEIGREIGSYDADARDELVRSVERVKAARDAAAGEDRMELELLARAIVKCFNRIRDFRYSKVLRTDTDFSSTLYLTKDELQKVKENAEKDELIREQREKIKRIADSYDLAYIEQAAALIMNEQTDYGEINKQFYVWSSTDKIVNFAAPEKAVKAELTFILPSEENELDGLGHVWIDNLDILSESGGSLDIRNGGFDEGEGMPFHWKPESRKGSPIMKWEENYPFSGGGDRAGANIANPSSQVSFSYKEGGLNRSIYLCNPTHEDEGAWTYDGEFAVDGGIGYTLTFAAKIDGKLKKGLKTVIVFKDEAGHVVDRFEYLFNRKSSLANSCFQLTMQCDAIQLPLRKTEPMP